MYKPSLTIRDHLGFCRQSHFKNHSL